MTFDLNSFVGNNTIPGMTSLKEMLSEEVFLVADTNVTPRQINHWEGLGMIPNSRADEQRWRRFTFVEFIWIHILRELRRMGVPLKVLAKVKENLLLTYSEKEMIEAMGGREAFREAYLPLAQTEEEKKFIKQFTSEEGWAKAEDVKTSSLEILITRILIQRVPINLVVFVNGDCYVIEHSKDFEMDAAISQRMVYDLHTTVSITSVINEFIASDLAPKRMGTLQFLEENERYILKILKSGEYSSVTVNYKDSEMSSLKLVKDQTTTRKIVDVLQEAKYQDIQIKTHNGIVTKIENTVKVNL